MKPYTWQLYSKSLTKKILHPTCQGILTEREGMRLITTQNCHVTLYFLIDETDGIVADSKFTAFGPTALIGALEVACILALRKHYAQVKRFTADLIDANEHFPQDTYPFLNLVVDLILEAMESCTDLPMPEGYIETPMPGLEEESSEYPGFTSLTKQQKITVIEQLIETDIRPYIELDAGGIRIIDLKDNELIIAYEGACTSCYSATGATLNAIQQMIATRIHPDLTVIPDPSTLQF